MNFLCSLHSLLGSNKCLLVSCDDVAKDDELQYGLFLALSNIPFQIAFLGLTSHERISLLKQSRHMKQTLSLRKTPYK